jgi:glycosyltransferase involved in cell wall biosynthesis
LPGIELRVLLLCEADPRRSYAVDRDSWRFDACVLPGRGALVGSRWLVVNRGVRRELRRFRPDVVVIGGWNQPAYFQAARARLPLVSWVESTARDARSGNRLLELLKRRLVAATDAFLVPGSAAREYVQSFGVEHGRIAVAPNAAEPAFVESIQRQRQRRDELRARLGVDRLCFLSVGRLAPEKGHDVLLRAAAEVPADVAVVGTGPQEQKLRALAPRNARLLGGLSRPELASWYVAADAFVLASRSEPWGIVVNEAAGAGLPIVVTDAVGAGRDLVEPDGNGLVVPAGDEGALRAALERVTGDDAFRGRAGARSLELAEQTTPAAWAEAVRDLALRQPTATATTGR